LNSPGDHVDVFSRKLVAKVLCSLQNWKASLRSDRCFELRHEKFLADVNHRTGIAARQRFVCDQDELANTYQPSACQ